MAEERHIAYMDSRYKYSEDLPDGSTKHHYTEERPVYCDGGTTLCDACETRLKKRYPQGWSHYPGDRCQHGVYIGGIGIDYMCHQCEME